MSDLKNWYDTASGNNAQSVPDAAVEGATTVADLNNCDREAQAAVRRYYETAEWRDFGYTISSTGASSVTFSGAIPLFAVGQRVKLTDDPAGVLYGTITNNQSQILTIDVDGGVTLTDVTAVEAGLNPTGDPFGVGLGAVYFGSLPFGSSTATLPSGWTLDKNVNGDNGHYIINHNLNTTDLHLIFGSQHSFNTSGYIVNADVLNESQITVVTKWLSGGNTVELDGNFSFIITRF